ASVREGAGSKRARELPRQRDRAPPQHLIRLRAATQGSVCHGAFFVLTTARPKRRTPMASMWRAPYTGRGRARRALWRPVERHANKATAQVARLGGTAHRAINTAADGATSGTEWASSAAEQAKQVQTRLTDSASDSIRARPIVTVAGALVIG